MRLSPRPKDVAPSGFFRATLNQVLPTLNLRWLLLDFGRRGNAWDAAKERLLAANLGFNRKHQEIIFNVQRAFLGLTSLRGKIAVAQSAVDAARAVRDSAEAQLRNGLATIPEVSLARQQEAQAAFDLEDVLATERDAQVALAESIGIPPTTPIQVTDFSALPLPAALEDSVDKVIDQALERRPDLIAKVAALRGKEAEVRRARAAYLPTLSLVSNVNTLAGRVKITGGNQPTGWFGAAEPSYGAGLAFQWNLFEGGATQRRVELAEAERRAAEDEVTAARDRAMRDVWKAYTDVRLAIRKLDVAAALVEASQKSYEAMLASYRQGLETLLNLLAARRELSRARFVEWTPGSSCSMRRWRWRLARGSRRRDRSPGHVLGRCTLGHRRYSGEMLGGMRKGERDGTTDQHYRFVFPVLDALRADRDCGSAAWTVALCPDGTRSVCRPASAGILESWPSRDARALGGFLQGLMLWLTRMFQPDPGARRILGRLLGIGNCIGEPLWPWPWRSSSGRRRPQTDDATVRANFVGIAPQVSGHIVELHVHDNQQAAGRRSSFPDRSATVRDCVGARPGHAGPHP